MKALAGTKVLDLSRYLSGPTATMLLADMGADVIKIESLPGGDPARESGPFHNNESVYYMASNRNKRSVAVNLRSSQGKALLWKLIADADVLVQNFKPGTLEKMGLDYATLRARNPRLILCSISGFGSHGAGRELPGFDQSAQAMSGLMSVTGTSATGPLRVGIAIGDSTAGVFAALAIVSALYQREHTGEGTHVETSLIESLVSLMSYQAQKYLSLHEVAGQDGNDHPLMFPQGTFPTKSSPITVASGNEAMWRRLCAVLGSPDLADDERFDSNAKRMENRVELRRLMEKQLTERPASEWLERINAAGVPATPIYNIGESLDSDIVHALRMIAPIEHPKIGTLNLIGPPLSIGGKGEWLRRPPPLLGEHTAEVMQEAGYSSDTIAALAESGTVFDPSITPDSDLAHSATPHGAP
jgi:crotonobetainyl-CoA:carnitine CoA-transferase CaiB-like acyl-CoA transferase